MLTSRRKFLLDATLAASSVCAAQPSGRLAVEFVSYEQVKRLRENCNPMLPAELAGLGEEALRREWPNWIRRRDREIHSRLLRGEEDSLVNFVLFGVSFTDQPRVSPESSVTLESSTRLLKARVQDFLGGIASPGNNERLLWLKDLTARQGYSTTTPEGRGRLARYVLQNISRYIAEQDQFRATFDKAMREADTTAAFSMKSELYQKRGLSVDTNFRPNFAIEQTLRELKRTGRLAAVRRAAIIGPGLDFADKGYGFDFYPLQTLQPFALIDSLLRLELARLPDLKVTVFDISSQTLNHLSRAIRQSHLGQPYTIQLVLDQTHPWNSDVLDYWRRFGDRVGAPVRPVEPPPEIQNVNSRAVRIRPEVVKCLGVQPLNMVLQHLELPAERQYDLIVATNVFVYYSAFEHMLSLLNVGSMMPARGVFLSNDLLQSCPGVTLKSIGNVGVEYSATPNDGDRVEIYDGSR